MTLKFFFINIWLLESYYTFCFIEIYLFSNNTFLYEWEMGFLLVKWVFFVYVFLKNFKLYECKFLFNILYSHRITYQMIFWYYKTILGNGNCENLLLRPFNANETNPPIWFSDYLRQANVVSRQTLAQRILDLSMHNNQNLVQALDPIFWHPIRRSLRNYFDRILAN